MSIQEVSGTAPVRPAALAPAQAVQPVDAVKPVAPPLEPAVRVEIRSGDRPPSVIEEPKPVEARPVEKTERRVTVDADTKSIVYQVVDSSYGNVVVQLPDPAVLKSRAYAEAAEAAAAKVHAERPVDRTA